MGRECSEGSSRAQDASLLDCGDTSAMVAPPSWRLQQLYLLWQQAQTRMTRWALGALAFVVLVPVLVLAPLERTTRAALELAQKVTALESRLDEQSVVAAELAQLQSVLAGVARSLEEFSSTERRDALVLEMQSLAGDWETLLRADGESRAAAQAYAGDDRRRIQSPINANQAIPNLAAPASPGPDSELDAASAAEIERSQNILDALERLHLDAETLLPLDESAREVAIRAAVTGRADEAADRAIEDAAEAMRGSVVAPIRRHLSENPQLAARVPELTDALDSVEEQLTLWKARLVADGAWYSTVSGKGDTMVDLKRAMARGPQVPSAPEGWLDRCQQLIQHQERSTAARMAALAEARVESDAEIAAEQTRLAALGDKLKAILPKWIGELISPQELLRLYPPATLVLLGAVAACAWRLRTTFVSLRRAARTEEIELDEIAESSTWTLARRAHAATLVTLTVHLGGIVVLWLFFSYGTGLSAASSEANTRAIFETPDSIIDSLIGPAAIPSFTIAGHLAFALAVVLVVLTLIRDKAPTKA